MDYIATFVDGHTASTLAHYGIKKQKWGVRRFQNPDGTLTEEGRRRYGVGAAASRAYEKSARYKAKSDTYAFKSRRALDKYDQFKSDKLKRKSEKYAVKSSNQYAKAVKLENKDDRIVNRKYSESDIYALEGAKRGGLLGAAIGKAVGVYKERQASRQDSDRLAKDDNKIDLGKDGDVIRAFAKTEGISITEAKRFYDSAMEDYEKVKDSDIVKKYPHDSETFGHPMEAGGYANKKLIDDIEHKSGSWYFGKAIKGSNFESAMKSYNRARDSFGKANRVRQQNGTGYSWHGSAEEKKAKQKLLDAVLKDLGFPITQANRDAISSSVFWD